MTVEQFVVSSRLTAAERIFVEQTLVAPIHFPDDYNLHSSDTIYDVTKDSNRLTDRSSRSKTRSIHLTGNVWCCRIAILFPLLAFNLIYVVLVRVNWH